MIDAAGTEIKVGDLLRWDRKQVDEIINGATPVTRDTAIQLERVVGILADT